MSSLYLHIPFCLRKCPYCDFYSLAGHAQELNAYPDLLVRHLRLLARDQGRAPLETVFFGGGTPSLLPPGAVEDLLAAIGDVFGLAPGAELSMEVNPGTVSDASLAAYRAAGVTRLSLGVQSLADGQLRRLGRGHTAAEARCALAAARRAGFDNLSADLMFALPGQPIAELLDDLQELAQTCDHLSCYGLTVEEGTPFHHRHRRGELALPEEDVCRDQFLAVDRLLTASGFRHYEISNYARPGFECRHNLGYWQRRTSLGIGAGAHTFCGAGWGERLAVPSDLGRYAELLGRGADPAETVESYDRRGAMAETLYLGLRTADGVDEALFAERFGSGVAAAFPEAVRRAGERLALRNGRWRLDLQGWLLFDHLIAPFLHEGP